MADNPLFHTPKSAWERYASPEDRQAMEDMALRYLAFLTACKTERETVRYLVDRAAAAGYVENLDSETYLRPWRGKTVLLARKGRRPLAEGFRLLGAHGDTPRLDLKQRPFTEDCDLLRAKTHYYGGIRKYQWLAIPLALHGVVVLADGRVVDIVLGEDDDFAFAIPDLLPHLAQKHNEQKISDGFEAEKLNIILGHEPAGKPSPEAEAPKDPVKTRILAMLHERYGIAEADFLSAELQAVPAGPARFIGLDKALIGSYGQDDRACVFCALEALLQAQAPEYTTLVLIWDKEEIGSDGATGAQSRFLEYCLEDLIAAWNPGTALRTAMLAGKALSADVHAPVDPDFQELHDAKNSARLGYGPSFSKFTGHRGKYGASEADAEYVGWLRGVLDARGIPWQMAELGKVDLGGGGTVAKFLAQYGMDVIDVGPCVLSMHSPLELSSKADIFATTEAFRAFLES
ncbi:aminopeptidase [Megalodesulfovibrio gigas]|uniref:M18 family aminopeptidase n=1 Tax=Megalodesulfovibrio gigas (strain ATCC 19364 / DSM 1382 / NCIMB 9332 / VKM B-1759) TaxID=1121448 RepID=T2GC08_MEGG1|nr:aminopeptidase [Megalodesulfovibrio gigas]AGW13651.1 putative peptidase M18 aminopeptidase I [Megalodesulfovibrio gigas DSM 1382 = ATCC 19364]